MAKSVIVTPAADRPNYYYVGADHVMCEDSDGLLWVYEGDPYKEGKLRAVWAKNQWTCAEISDKEGS